MLNDVKQAWIFGSHCFLPEQLAAAFKAPVHESEDGDRLQSVAGSGSFDQCQQMHRASLYKIITKPGAPYKPTFVSLPRGSANNGFSGEFRQS